MTRRERPLVGIGFVATLTLAIAAAGSAAAQSSLAPTNVVATANGSTVTLSWSPPTSGTPQYYLVFFGPTLNEVTHSFNVGLVTSVSGQLAPGTYYLSVLAQYPGAPPRGAPTVAVTVGPNQAPGQPGTPVATVNGDSVTITWAPPATGGTPTHYLIEAGANSGSRDIGTFNVGMTNSISATPGPRTYYIRIVAVNGAGFGLPSAETEFTIAGPTRPGPSGKPTVIVTGNVVTVSWLPPTSGGAPASYLVFAGTSRSSFSSLGTFNVGAARSVTATVAPGVYFVSVAGGNDVGVGLPSEATFFAVAPGPNDGTWNGESSDGGEVALVVSGNRIREIRIVTTPGPCVGRQENFDSVPISGAAFSASSGANASFDGYTLTGTFSADTVSGTLSYTSIRQGCNASGTITWTANRSGLGQPFLPTQPLQLRREPTTLPIVRLAWEAPWSLRPDSYDVEIGTSPGGSEVRAVSVSTEDANETLGAGTYYLRVRGRNSAGAGRPSNEITITVP